MTSLPFVLRDHREELWRRWLDAMDEDVPTDYREIVGSPLGERYVRGFIDDLIAWSEAEEYEAPRVLRAARERVSADAANRLALGFMALEIAAALQALRRAVIDVLLDALVLDELPSFGETLEQLRAVGGFVDQLVVAVLRTPAPPAGPQ